MLLGEAYIAGSPKEWDESCDSITDNFRVIFAPIFGSCVSGVCF